MVGQRNRQHEKSMASYEHHAWSDALSIAELIDSLFGYAVAKKAYGTFSRKEVLEFEAKYVQQIGDFIQKSESQREPYLRRIAKDVGDDTKILFLTLSLLGVLRAKALMELRDRFRNVLAPGRGNRITTASLYDFSNEMPSLFEYAWPARVFDSIEVSRYDDEE
jgi:hypothetical protein